MNLYVPLKVTAYDGEYDEEYDVEGVNYFRMI